MPAVLGVPNVGLRGCGNHALLRWQGLVWELDFEAGEPQEVAVVGAEGSAVFDGRGPQGERP